MLEICLAPIATICALGFILNAILLPFILREKENRAFRILLLSLSCSDIALIFVLLSRSVIPLFLTDNASTNFAAFTFGIYCNMLNIIILTIERMITTCSGTCTKCCASKCGMIIIITFIWVGCIPLSVALGIFDLYDGIRDIMLTKIIPLCFAATSFVAMFLHFIMCCVMHRAFTRDYNGRSLRSLGRGLFLSTRRALELRQEYYDLGLSFGLILSYLTFNYPFMLYSFLNYERVDHCEGTQHNFYNIVICLMGCKTIADPLLCIFCKVCLPRYQKQLRRSESESST